MLLNLPISVLATTWTAAGGAGVQGGGFTVVDQSGATVVVEEDAISTAADTTGGDFTDISGGGFANDCTGFGTGPTNCLSVATADATATDSGTQSISNGLYNLGVDYAISSNGGMGTFAFALNSPANTFEPFVVANEAENRVYSVYPVTRLATGVNGFLFVSADIDGVVSCSRTVFHSSGAPPKNIRDVVPGHIDDSGNLLIGYTAEANVGAANVAGIARFTPACAGSMVQAYDLTTNDFNAMKLAGDAANDAFVLGGSLRGIGGSVDTDGFVIEFSSVGAVATALSMDAGTPATGNIVNHVFFDANDRAVAVGEITPQVGGVGGSDAYVLRFDGTGSSSLAGAGTTGEITIWGTAADDVPRTAFDYNDGNVIYVGSDFGATAGGFAFDITGLALDYIGGQTTLVNVASSQFGGATITDAGNFLVAVNADNLGQNFNTLSAAMIAMGPTANVIETGGILGTGNIILECTKGDPATFRYTEPYTCVGEWFTGVLGLVVTGDASGNGPMIDAINNVAGSDATAYSISASAASSYFFVAADPAGGGSAFFGSMELGSMTVPEFSAGTLLLALLASGFLMMFVMRRNQ